jgi:glutathione synthase/RimK-type ligase-like ATP-grasp enzyme
MILQSYIASDHEMRFYVMDREVIPVRLRRRLAEGVIDVREMRATADDVTISSEYERYHATILDACCLLGLRYAVIDAIPKDGEPHILEVNPNGVWTNLPRQVGDYVRRRFHQFLCDSLSSPSDN